MGEPHSDLRVLDLGAGNGMMGEELQKSGIARLVGADIIPVQAFFSALKLIKINGWLAFNIKQSFLNHPDQTGFSRLIRELIFSKYLHVHHLELYRHRLSMEGTPLFYYALTARLTESIPEDFLESHQIHD